MNGAFVRAYQRFWLDFAVSPTHLLLLRVALFALLGIDAFLQIEHAPRYGAGNFNVPHIPGLDALLPAPSRSLFAALYLLQAYLSIRIALGTASRALIGVLAALIGYTYFISQLNSYQHHYLLFLVVLLCAFIPWNAAAGQKSAPAVKSWALRLIMVEIAIVYFWAAIGKLDPLWLDGRTLTAQLSGTFLAPVLEGLGASFSAKLVVATELFLALAWLMRRLWLPALIIGVSFHITIEVTSFEIGLFSYYMLALYLLLVPERALTVAVGVLGRAVAPLVRVGRAMLGWLGASWRLWAILALAAVGGTALIRAIPLREAGLAAAVMTGLLAVSAARAGRMDTPARNDRLARLALAHLLACGLIAGLGATTETCHNYYKFWGGAARRLGDEAQAKAAYEALVKLSPWHGPSHYHLGTIYVSEGRVEEALASFRRAQAASPSDWRPLLSEALIHHRAGRGAQAIDAIDRMLALKPPKEQAEQALALKRQWQSQN